MVMTAGTFPEGVNQPTELDVAQARISELEAALKPFASYVDKSSCKITMVWRDGDYVSTYTNTLKPSDFWAATVALKTKP